MTNLPEEQDVKGWTNSNASRNSSISTAINLKKNEAGDLFWAS
jgi:hypothetical protein